MALFSATWASRKAFSALRRFSSRVGEIDFGLGDVEFRFRPDLEKRPGLIEVMLKLSHDLLADIPIPLRLQKSVVGLFDTEDHLGADVLQIRTEGIPVQLLDLHLRGGPAEIVEVLAQRDGGRVAVVDESPDLRRPAP